MSLKIVKYLTFFGCVIKYNTCSCWLRLMRALGWSRMVPSLASCSSNPERMPSTFCICFSRNMEGVALVKRRETQGKKIWISFLLKKKKRRILLDVVPAYNKNQIKEKCACKCKCKCKCVKNRLRKKNPAPCYNFVLNFLLFIIKIDKGVDVINLVICSPEFGGQWGGGGSQGFFGQNRLNLSLDRRLLRLQFSYSLSRFLEGKSVKSVLLITRQTRLNMQTTLFGK